MCHLLNKMTAGTPPEELRAMSQSTNHPTNPNADDCPWHISQTKTVGWMADPIPPIVAISDLLEKIDGLPW